MFYALIKQSTHWALCSSEFFNSKYQILPTYVTAWNVSKYGVISGPYFPVFSPNTGKYGPEIALYLDPFHAVREHVSSYIICEIQCEIKCEILFNIRLFDHIKKGISSEVLLRKLFWKYTANLQKNTHAEVRFQ